MRKPIIFFFLNFLYNFNYLIWYMLDWNINICHFRLFWVYNRVSVLKCKKIKPALNPKLYGLEIFNLGWIKLVFLPSFKRLDMEYRVLNLLEISKLIYLQNMDLLNLKQKNLLSIFINLTMECQFQTMFISNFFYKTKKFQVELVYLWYY